MFGRLGFTEILILVAVFLLFFGAKKIPEAAKSIAKALKEFKRELGDKGDSVEKSESAPDHQDKKEE